MKPTLLSSLARTLPQPAQVPPAYRPLHKYLADRYAVVVVLTLDEIQDLLGFSLPDEARLQSDWWSDIRADGSSSPQSSAWISAQRSSVPSLLARKVTFRTVGS
jgi:hypothetical protein